MPRLDAHRRREIQIAQGQWTPEKQAMFEKWLAVQEKPEVIGRLNPEIL